VESKVVSKFLTIDHVKQSLSQDIEIASNGNKRFTFHVWLNEYRIWVDGRIVSSGQALEELMIEYDDL
jgi:hypothetical protein